MKKIVLVALATLSLLSCSKSSNDETTTNSTIDGTWKLTTFTTDDACDFNNDGVLTRNFITETGCYNNSKIVFNTGNIATLYMQTLDITFNIGPSYGPLGYQSITDCGAATDPENMSWVNNNNNTITIGTGVDAAIFTVSGNTLTTHIPEFTEVYTLENGVKVTRVTGATLVFTKQ